MQKSEKRKRGRGRGREEMRRHLYFVPESFVGIGFGTESDVLGDDPRSGPSLEETRESRNWVACGRPSF